jgi:hypothetical protein
MRRTLLILLMAVFAAAVPAAAQLKQPRPREPKDEGLHYVLLQQVAKLEAAIQQVADKVGALESELQRIKQQNADASTEIRSIQTTLKTNDTTFSNFRLSNEQGLLNIKSDLVQLRTDLASLNDTVKRSLAMAAPVVEAPAGPAIEGYIVSVSEREVTISLGSGSGVRQGMRLGVFPSADPKTQIGIVVVTDVVDANNSRAEIIIQNPGARFQFSDIVRPI